MPSRRSRREKNRAKKIAKLNDDCCVGESQDIDERDSFQEAHEKKKTCDRKRYKANPESKKDSMKAQYWLDPESKKDSAKAQWAVPLFNCTFLQMTIIANVPAPGTIYKSTPGQAYITSK